MVNNLISDHTPGPAEQMRRNCRNQPLTKEICSTEYI